MDKLGDNETAVSHPGLDDALRTGVHLRLAHAVHRRYEEAMLSQEEGGRYDQFVTQLLEGDYGSFSEDRLTQVTAACFNNSALFRSCLLKFLKVRNARRTSNVVAHTQRTVRQRGEYMRLDLVLSRGKRVVAIVENKVDSPLHASQLKLYSAIRKHKGARKVALVREYLPHPDPYGEWAILHWRDLYSMLSRRLDGRTPVSKLDAFVVGNFLAYLKEARMHTPHMILKQDMDDLAAMLHAMRFVEKRKYRGAVAKFDTADNWVTMMGAIVERSRCIKKLAKAAKKNYRFNPWVEHWYDGERSNKEYCWCAVTSEITFARPVGHTRGVGIGLFVDGRKQWKIEVYRRRVGTQTADWVCLVDGRSNVVLSQLSKKVLAKWQQWIR